MVPNLYKLVIQYGTGGHELSVAPEKRARRIQQREWWLWATAMLVTLLLTLGMISFLVPMMRLSGRDPEPFQLSTLGRGLVSMVLLFDLTCPLIPFT